MRGSEPLRDEPPAPIVTGGHSVPSAVGEGTSRPPEHQCSGFASARRRAEPASSPLAPAQPHPAGPSLVAGGVALGAPPALTLLRAHADRGLTGELVLRGDGGHVRVYLQAGRVAWASDSQHHRGFTEQLKALAGIDDRTLEAVIHECKRTRQPIGEALLAWNVATEGQVRDALRHQITTALALATAEPHPRAAFMERAEYASYDARFTFDVAELLAPGGPTLAAIPRPPPPADGAQPPPEDAAASPGQPKHEESQDMSVMEKLKELQGIDGFAGAAVFTPSGEQLALLDGDAQRLREVGVLANNVLLNAQKASLEMGAGRGQMVHVEGEKAHVLVRCLNEGSDPLKSQPGKAHIHVVLVLKSEASIGLAKMRIGAAAQKLAEDFRS